MLSIMSNDIFLLQARRMRCRSMTWKEKGKQSGDQTHPLFNFKNDTNAHALLSGQCELFS